MYHLPKFPFKIGCTSYVLPDEILPNVAFMASKVDDIELVLFESGAFSNIPDNTTIISLQAIAKEHDITFSVHFPIDRKAGSQDSLERKQFLETTLQIIDSTEMLPVSSYILHFEGLTNENSESECNRWQSAVCNFCDEFCKKGSCSPDVVAVENLSYHPRLHSDIVSSYGFRHCIDLGHLWLQNINWEEYLMGTLPSTSIIHLHGVNADRHDHVSLAQHSAPLELEQLPHLLSGYRGVVTLEVFSEPDTFQSLKMLENIWQK